MNDAVDIDLRKVIRILQAKLIWILGFSILVGAAVFVFLISQPKKYEATAVVAFTEPHNSLNTVMDNMVAMDIARSYELAGYVFDAWNDPEKKPDDRYDFYEENLSVKAGSNDKVIVLTVRLEAADEAARLANLWAKKVVERIDSLYSGQDEIQLAFFEDEIKLSSAKLEKAQSALAEFQGQNAVHALEAQLNDLLAQQKDFLQREQLIASLKRDAKALLREVDGLSGAPTLPAEMQTRLLVLQLRQYSGAAQVQTDENSSTTVLSPLQYQLPALTAAEPISVADYRSSIDGWVTSLEEQSTEIQQLLTAYPQNLASLQQQIELLKKEEVRLTLEVELASSAYAILNEKYQETNIGTKDSIGNARIAAQAYPTTHSSLLETLAFSFVALLGAAILAITFVLAQDWWRRVISSASAS